MRNLLKKLPTFLFELLIVFVGVYAAFSLNNYREGQKAVQSQIKYAESFLSEMEFNAQRAKYLKAQLDSIVTNMEAEIAAGKKPRLAPLPKLYFSVGTSVTRAAFSENHFEAIDKNFLFNISQGVVLFDDINYLIRSFRQKAREQLYVSEPDFYLPSGQLKEEYQWYLDDLNSLRYLFDRLIFATEKGAVPGSKALIKKLKEK